MKGVRREHGRGKEEVRPSWLTSPRSQSRSPSGGASLGSWRQSGARAGSLGPLMMTSFVAAGCMISGSSRARGSVSATDTHSPRYRIHLHHRRVVILAMSAADPLSAIVAALEKEQIIPDILPAAASFTPSVLFSVVYPNGAEVNLGNELTVEETQDEPEIRLAALNGPWDDAPAAEVSYTLAMLDPDAPYRADAIYRSFRHWVVCLLYDFHA